MNKQQGAAVLVLAIGLLIGFVLGFVSAPTADVQPQRALRSDEPAESARSLPRSDVATATAARNPQQLIWPTGSAAAQLVATETLVSLMGTPHERVQVEIVGEDGAAPWHAFVVVLRGRNDNSLCEWSPERPKIEFA